MAPHSHPGSLSRIAEEPLAGKIVSMVLSLSTLTIIAICLVRRVQGVKFSMKLPPTFWLVLTIYVNSFLFVFLTTIFRDVGLNKSLSLCEGAILLCLTLYLITKVGTYLFLVEKAHIVSGSLKPRMKSKRYLFNMFCMLVPYIVVAVLNLVFRIAYLDEKGQCIIGMERFAMASLVGFDVAVNIYLTLLFLIPLRKLYSYKNGTSNGLRTVAFRTFIGSLLTLTSTIINLAVIMYLDGEPGWLCFMSCNLDVLFAVVVLHWVTSTDKVTSTGYGSSRSHGNASVVGNTTSRSRTGGDKSAVVSHCEAQPGGGQDIALDRIMVTHTHDIETDHKSHSSETASVSPILKDRW